MEAAVNRLSPVCLRCLAKIDESKRVSTRRCVECFAREMAAIDLGTKVQYNVNWTRTLESNATTRQFDRLMYKCMVVNGVKFKGG